MKRARTEGRFSRKPRHARVLRQLRRLAWSLGLLVAALSSGCDQDPMRGRLRTWEPPDAASVPPDAAPRGDAASALDAEPFPGADAAPLADASRPDAQQVVPDSGAPADAGPSDVCNPPCSEGTSCLGGQCSPTGDPDDLAYCVQLINGYRASIAVAPLPRDPELEAFAAAAARADGISGRAHGYWTDTHGGQISNGENELPWWPLAGYGTVRRIMEVGTQAMWDEGPSGGHYQNIAGWYWRHTGCGVYVDGDGVVTVTQEFN